MSLFLVVELDNDTKQKIYVEQMKAKRKVDGKWEDQTRFHISIKDLKDSNFKDIEKAMSLFKHIYNPVKEDAIVKNIFRFEQGVSWAGIDNNFPLYKIKYQFEDCCKKLNINLPKDSFDGYTPHITIGYNVGEYKMIETNAIDFKIDNICLWNGFKVNSEYIHNFLYKINFN